MAPSAPVDATVPTTPAGTIALALHRFVFHGDGEEIPSRESSGRPRIRPVPAVAVGAGAAIATSAIAGTQYLAAAPTGTSPAAVIAIPTIGILGSIHCSRQEHASDAI